MKRITCIFILFVAVLISFSCSKKSPEQSEDSANNNINYPRLNTGSMLSFKSDFNGTVFVADDSKYRYMIFETPDGDIQSKVSLADKSELFFPCAKASMLGLALFDSPGTGISNILMIGLGGGSMPRFLMKYLPKVKIDSVEIDPVVIDVAKNYMFTEENDNHKIFAQDGREFIEKAEKKYDIIFLDAFNADDNIPKQLTSAEFLKAAKNCLSKNGLLATNFINYNQAVYESIYKTYTTEFRHVLRFNLIKFDRKNIILMAFDDDAKMLTSEIIKSRIENHPEIYDKKFDFKEYADTLNSDNLTYSNAMIIRDDGKN